MLVQGVTDYAIYMLDPDGRITNWNTGAERIKGYRERRDRRRALLPLLYRGGSRRGTAGSSRSQTAAREGRFEKEGWRVRKDGTPVLGASSSSTRSRTATAT